MINRYLYDRVIENFQDIIGLLRRENDVNLETDGSVLHIDVRRDFLLPDAIREGQKSKFDPQKVLRVRKILLYIQYSGKLWRIPVF